MPYISRLKKLGTLPVSRLHTVLTVYLIHLESSNESNLVFTSSHPIPADAAIPPADLHFESPEASSKPGDVLIYASRVQKKACYVHACWVFVDAGRWVRPHSESEIMMDHPVHPGHQLIILSGPYVKWELKPDPDREPSLSIPDPPPVRPGARGTVNTIQPPSQSHDPDLNRPASPRLRDNDITGSTPDGSAAVCSSSRFSTPLSDISDEEKTQCRKSLPAVKRRSSSTPPLPPPSPAQAQSADSADSPESSSSVAERPASRPRSASDTSSATRRDRVRPKGSRAMPSARDITPVTGVPPTPVSAHTLLRRNSLSTVRSASKPPPRPRLRKRNRPVDDDFSVATPRTAKSASWSGSSCLDMDHPAKRRRLGSSPRPMPARLTLRIPPFVGEREGEEDRSDETSSGSPESSGSIWDQLEDLQREKEVLVTQVQQATEEFHSFQKWKAEAAEKQRKTLEQRDAALGRVQELDLAKASVEASLRSLQAESDDRIAKFRDERDEACRVADKIKAEIAELGRQRDAALAEASEAKRAAEEVAEARARDLAAHRRDVQQLEEEHKPHQAQLEETVRQLDEQKRRATSLEASLRVAHEALARQRAHAQEAELEQHKVISELAKDLQEKDQATKELAAKSERLERQVADFREIISTQESVLEKERDDLRRANAALECAKNASQTQITALQGALFLSRESIAAAEEKASASQALVDQLSSEKKACDMALKEGDRKREELEARLRAAEVSNGILEEMHKAAEECCVQERRAKQVFIDEQGVQFLEYLSCADRERERLTELALEMRASAQRDLASKARELECAQAEAAQLREELAALQEKFFVELSAYKERQEEATVACETMEIELSRCRAELALTGQSLEHAHREFAASSATAEAERDMLGRELGEARERLAMAVMDSNSKLAESATHYQRLEQERGALQLQCRAQAQDLEIARGAYAQLTEEGDAERRRLAAELAAATCRFEEQCQASQEQLAAASSQRVLLEQSLRAQCDGLELRACRAAEELEAAREEGARLEMRLCAERERCEGELATGRARLEALESALDAANEARTTIAKDLAEEVLVRERVSRESAARVEELEGVRAEFAGVAEELAAARQALQDAASSEASLARELDACRGSLAAAEEAAKCAQDALAAESHTLAHSLEESTRECARLGAALAAEREKLRVERTLAPDGLRAQMASVEAALETESAGARALRTELARAREQSSAYWAELGSQLLRSLHDVQDRLKIEQGARQALQEELASLEQLREEQQEQGQEQRPVGAAATASELFVDEDDGGGGGAAQEVVVE